MLGVAKTLRKTDPISPLNRKKKTNKYYTINMKHWWVIPLSSNRTRTENNKTMNGGGGQEKTKEYLVSIAKGCEGWKIATLFQNPTYGVCCTGPNVKKHCLFHTICPKNLLLLSILNTLLFGSQQIPSRGVVIMSAADQHWALTLAFIPSLAIAVSSHWSPLPPPPITNTPQRGNIWKWKHRLDALRYR